MTGRATIRGVITPEEIGIHIIVSGGFVGTDTGIATNDNGIPDNAEVCRTAAISPDADL